MIYIRDIDKQQTNIIYACNDAMKDIVYSRSRKLFILILRNCITRMHDTIVEAIKYATNL